MEQPSVVRDMKISVDDFVLSGGDLGRYQIFLVLVSSLSICMHTFGLTLEVCNFTNFGNVTVKS